MLPKIRILLLLSVVLLTPGAQADEQSLFTREELGRVAQFARADLVDALLENQAYLAEAEINTRLRLANFLSQIMLETNGLRRIDENMNYSASRLRQVFRTRVSQAKATELAGISPRPEKERAIANWVYGNRDDLGNLGRHTDDGWNYRGSGYIQLTGRANFRDRGAEIGLPLEDNPELARQPVEGLEAATAYWDARSINNAADLNDRYRVRVLVNGTAAHGYEQGRQWFNRIWNRIYRDRQPFDAEGDVFEAADELIDEAEDASQLLEDLGFLSTPGNENEGATEDYNSALRAYQRSRGLPETGILDDETFHAITDPAEWRGTAEPPEETELFDPEEGDTFFLDNDTGEESGDAGDLPPFLVLTDTPSGPKLSLIEKQDLEAATGAHSPSELAEGEYDQFRTFVPRTVIGNDTREERRDASEMPTRVIAQIMYKRTPGSDGKLCSGTMIAPSFVLTAGHCVHSGTREGKPYASFDVYPARVSDRKPFGACKGVRTFALKGWTRARTRTKAKNYDLGVIKLDCDVGNKTGWVAMASPGQDAMGVTTLVQGYSKDRESSLQFLSKDKVRHIDTFRLFYENDTGKGTSGAPVMAEGDLTHVFCVHVSGLHNGPPYREYNSCTRLTPEVIAQVDRWMRQN